MSDVSRALAELRAAARAESLTREGAARGTEHDGGDEAALQALDDVAHAGLASWTVPELWGGASTGGLAGATEVSCRALCAIRAGLAYRSGMLDVMLAMQGLGSYPIARAGNDLLRAEMLPKVARGALVAAFALTEEPAGSDLGGIATRAERQGDAWRISGTKTFISNAGLASFYTLLARTSGEPGDGGQGSLTMFFVPADAPGISTRRFEVTAPHPIGEVRFDGVVVPDAYRLGAVGSGLDVALATLGRFRTTVAAAATGFARRAFDESIAHLRARTQFGKPLAANQGLRFDVAEMDTRLRAAELLVDEAATQVDAGERATAEVARAKLFATEAASWICDRAVQHLGGLGVKRGTVVERLWREARALRIYEGTSEVQKLVLARELFG